MNPHTEERIARQLLETRERGFSYSLYLRHSFKQYLVLFLVIGVGCVALAFMEVWTALWLMIGMLAGSLLRDFGWVRRASLNWPFNVKVMDWDKVQAIADGTPEG